MRSSFPSAELDEFIQVNAPVLGRLRALRDKFLHPAKDEAYDGLLRGFVEATEQNYPSHLPFGKHLQILLDEHLEAPEGTPGGFDRERRSHTCQRTRCMRF